MKNSEETKQTRKEALKELREARKTTILEATRRMKEQKKTIEAIRQALKEGGQTVPELAASVGIGPSEALWYVASLKKYGEIAEGEKDGGYFRYELAKEASH